MLTAVNKPYEGMNISNFYKFSDCDIHLIENVGVCYLCVALRSKFHKNTTIYDTNIISLFETIILYTESLSTTKHNQLSCCELLLTESTPSVKYHGPLYNVTSHYYNRSPISDE